MVNKRLLNVGDIVDIERDNMQEVSVHKNGEVNKIEG